MRGGKHTMGFGATGAKGDPKLQMFNLALAALLMNGLVACATGFEDNNPRNGTGGQSSSASGEAGAGPGAGGGNMGGNAGSGGGGTAGGPNTTGGSGGSGGGNDLCGNGVKDIGEQCDGADFGGKTCADFGLGTGDLVCNAFCGIVASACLPKESCVNFKDDDQDGLVDCLDSDCTTNPACLDSCASPKSLSIPGFSDGDTTGRPSTVNPTCTPQSGSEVIYRLDPTISGPMTIDVNAWNGNDVSVSLRTACDSKTAEIKCVNNIGPNDFGDEMFTIDVTAGQTYYLVVDDVGPNAGPFFVNVTIPEPEQFCTDFFDDDGDGFVDCDDATVCQSTFDCQSGTTAVGQQCTSNFECAANMNDPVCLTTTQGFLDGYCSEWCDVAAQDCSGDAVCADLGLSKNGVCLDGCMTDADCRPNYACVDKGYSSKVCMLAPESNCSDYIDEDLDNRIDCEDSDCQGTTDCTGGAKLAGQPCSLHNECYSVDGDPLCLSEQQYGYPGGYCSEYCYFMNDCGPGSVCSNFFFFPSGAGTCMRTCVDSAQCRPGYACLDVGLTQKLCLH